MNARGRLIGSAVLSAALALAAVAPRGAAAESAAKTARKGKGAQTKGRRTARRADAHASRDAAQRSDLSALAGTPEAGGDSLAPNALAALIEPRVRKIAIAQFAGSGGERLRGAVLEVLSAHADLELLGFRDIDVVAHRLGIGQTEPHDRKRLSAELGVYAWVDGDAQAETLRLSDGDDRTLASIQLDDRRPDAQARERVWPEFGRFISDEGMRQHRVAAAREAATKLLAAQDAELARQQEIAARREQLRVQRLAAAKNHARTVLEAQSAEQQRQVMVAAELRRKREDEARRQALAAQQAEAQRQAEAARQAQLAQQAEAQRQAEAARQAQLAQQQAQYQYANPPAATYGQPAAGQFSYQQPPPQQPAYGYGAQPPAYGAPQAPAAPVAGEVDGISPETRQWLLEHRARTGQQ
jgi:hypothetical protein